MKVTAVISCDLPPDYYWDKKTNRASGFAVDLMEMIAERAGLQVNYICKNSWPEVISLIESGKADLGIMSINEERKKRLMFSVPFDVINGVFFARADSKLNRDRIPEQYALVGIYKEGSTFYEIRNKPGMRIVEYNGHQQGLFGLLSGEIDLYAGPETTIIELSRRMGIEGKIKVVGKPIKQNKRGFAVRKGNEQLLARLNSAMDVFIGSPEYNRIFAKWYPAPAPYWNAKRIALASGCLIFILISSMGLWRYFSIKKLNKKLLKNIAERKKTEEDLQSVTQRLKLASQSANLGIWDWDIANNIMVWDDRMLELYGLTRETFSGGFEAWQNGLHPEDRDKTIEEFQAALRGQKEWDADFRVLHPNGTVKHIKANGIVIRDSEGNPVRMLGINFDITGHKNLEHQLRQAQKMEAVGLLAGGVAHDFNNMLTAIIGYGSLLNAKLGKDSELRPFVDQILSSAGKSANLTRQLLAFSRKQEISPKETDLNELIKGMEKLLLRLIGEDVELKTQLAGKGITVMVDPGQIEQVLMNLSTNARDAMPDGGVLSICTDTVELDTNYVKGNDMGKAGMYALISVTDTGSGMDEKTQQKIFEPFFTTKEVGKGTGLGLSMVYGIIKQHGGNITVYSESGKGTTFRIYLPLIESKIEEAKVAEIITPKGGTETILFAEDNEEVRVLAKKVLEENGYKVMDAVDGEEAINKFKENKDSIQLIIIDVIMPKKSGKEAIDEIRKIKPDVNVLFTSGYTSDIISSKGILEEGMDFISKPVTPNNLLAKMRKILDKDTRL